MSEHSTPAGGKQEKTMSSRLLTMKFMQRAAASKSIPFASSPNPTSSPQDGDEHEAKRQKLSPAGIQTPTLDISSPNSLYDSDQPTSPWTRDRGTNSAQQVYGGNAAETPWVLNLSGTVDRTYQLNSPQETGPSQQAMVGRRTFGDFEKKSAKKVVAVENGEDSDSLGSGCLDSDFDQHSPRTNREMLQNRVKSIGKKRKSSDNDKMDSVRLQKLRNGGISAASGMRQPGLRRRS